MALTKVKAGNIILTTPGASSNDVTPATTQYVTTAIDNLVDTAPSTLNTLNELAAALGDDVNFSTTVTSSIATKLPLAGGTLTGLVQLNADIAVGEDYKIRSQASSGGSHLMLRSDNLGVTGNSLSLIGLNDILIGAKSNNSGTGNIYFGVGSENKTSGWTDTLTILESANVGIGTTTPDSPLEISGADDTRLKLTDTGDSSELMLRSDGVNTQIYTNTAHDLGIYTSGNVGQLHLKQSNGNVGIGTTAPTAPLQLNTAGNTADGTYYSTFTINNTGSSTWSRLRFDRGGVARWGISLGTDDKFKISNLYTGGSVAIPDDNVLVIDNNSKVGIGTDSPNSKLMVIDTTDARKQIEFSNHVTYRGSIGHDAATGRNEYRSEAGGGRHAFFRGATSTTPEMEILQDGQILMPYQSSAMAHKNGSYLETTGINDVTGWTIQHNIGSDLSTSGSYTCPQAGRYLCTFSAMSGQTGGDVQFRICRGATILLGSNSMAQGGGPWRQTTVTGVVNAALGDVLKPVAYSNASSSIQQVYTGSYSTLSFHFLG